MSHHRTAVQLTIKGRVQGVYFRAHVREAAQARGVAGWAENRPDGSVEVRLEGGHEAVAAVEEACSQGPPAARVDAVDRREVEIEGLTEFETR